MQNLLMSNVHQTFCPEVNTQEEPSMICCALCAVGEEGQRTLPGSSTLQSHLDRDSDTGPCRSMFVTSEFTAEGAGKPSSSFASLLIDV